VGGASYSEEIPVNENKKRNKGVESESTIGATA